MLFPAKLIFFPVVIAERFGFRPVGVSSCFAHRNLLPRLIEVTLLIGMKPLFLSSKKCEVNKHYLLTS